MPYTQSLGLELITPGSQAGLWGNTTNNSLTLIDQAVTGVTPWSFNSSGETWTLTDYNGAADEARSAVLNIGGSASGTNTVVIPNKQKTYFIRNGTGKEILFRTAGSGQQTTVDADYNFPIFCDGNNNVYPAIKAPGAATLTVSGGGTGATTFGAGGVIKSPGGTADLTAGTVSLTSEVTGTLPVANGGTGRSSMTAGNLLLGNGTNSVALLQGSSTGDVVTWNAGSQTWESKPNPTAGVTSVAGNNTVTISPPGGTGNVTISLTGTNVGNALGYTPASSSNFQSLKNINGWQKLENGIIIQWGQANSVGTGYLNWTATLPTTFPNAPLRVVAIVGGYTTLGVIAIGQGNSTTSSITGTLYTTVDGTNWGTQSGINASYIAIGY